MSFFSSSHFSVGTPHVSIHSLISDHVKYVNPTIQNIMVLTTHLDITTTCLSLYIMDYTGRSE